MPERSRSRESTIKPDHRAIRTYYDQMTSYADMGITKETSVRTATIQMFTDTAKTYGWILITEQGKRVAGRTIFPDATFYLNGVPRGYWEAKDTADNLDQEIRNKIARGYPTGNIIFEDTRTAVLVQHGTEQYRIDLTDPVALTRLLNDFFRYDEPVLHKYDEALEDFTGRVPELSTGLKHIIQEAHKKNKKFQTAFTDFYELCKTALNPNISLSAVDEMLVQHLLTERLIRKIFDNPEFTRRNVIAAEIEKVIAALVSQSFNRDDYLRSLDSFFTAIESAAHGLDFKDKQTLLNEVYERFFQGYSTKIADTHGIVYTPQPIVDFMCASVVEVLQNEFGKTLGDPDVVILDPATGTGNFIVNLLRRAPKQHLESLYRDRLFANEIMLLPYYIASLNIEHAYYELSGVYEPFEGICFVDTLDLAESAQMRMSFMTEENTARVQRQKQAPITVIIGNPPYNMGQANENDNNKNRAYEVIDKRIAETYVKDSNATLNTKLYDAYVKFFRWASDRLQGRDGVVCFVSNNGFFQGIAFDGFRKHMLQDFTSIYHLDLSGNARTSGEQRKREGGNVFDDKIRVGVGITIAIRSSRDVAKQLLFHRVPDYWQKEEKLGYLVRATTNVGSQTVLNTVKWSVLRPNNSHSWLVAVNTDEFTAYVPIGSKATKASSKLTSEAIFKTYSLGVVSSRDDHVYSFDLSGLKHQAETYTEIYNATVDRAKRRGNRESLDMLADTNDPRIKWSRQVKTSLTKLLYSEFNEANLRQATYRPFTKKHLYFDDFWNEERYQQPQFFPSPSMSRLNRVIALTDLGSEKPFMALVVNHIADYHLVGAGSSTQCFPYFVYDENNTIQKENITDWALTQFRDHYADSSITKWDIFYYVYGVLHHPVYRTKFADNLKRELPRIPFAPDFRSFAEAGKKLADLHLNYETVTPYPLKWIETPNTVQSFRVEKMKLNKDKTSIQINHTLTLSGIPPETFNYRLGNRSALDWVIDQYQVSTDKRSGITSDPNGYSDDPRYIVDLVCRIVTVSLETVNIVNALPTDYTDTDGTTN